MLQGVLDFFKGIIEEEVQQRSTSTTEPELDEFELKERQNIGDYVKEYWDYVTEFNGGNPPTCKQHLLAGIAQVGDWWFVPTRHIVVRYLNADSSFYNPAAVVDTEFGSCFVFDSDKMNMCIQCIAELCHEHGGKPQIVVLEQKEDGFILINDENKKEK